MWVLGHFSHIQLLAALWTVTCQAPLPMGFSRRESWNGLPFPSPGNLPDPGIEPISLTSPELAGGFFTTNATWVAHFFMCVCVCVCVHTRVHCRQILYYWATREALCSYGHPRLVHLNTGSNEISSIFRGLVMSDGRMLITIYSSVYISLHLTLQFKITQSAKASWERLTHAMALYFTTETWKEQSWVQH